MQIKTKKTEGKNFISKNQTVNWKLFIILLIAGIFGTIAVLPYTLTLEGGLLQNLKVPFYVLIYSQIIQAIILLVFTIFFGLYFAKKVGLGVPILEG